MRIFKVGRDLAHHPLLALFLLGINAGAADFYWVGGTGNWSDYAAHWATASGGSTFRTGVPQASDNVIFDNLSFSAAGQTVTIDQNPVYCNNMTWTGVSNSPTLAGSFSNTLRISGSLTLVSGMSQSFIGPFSMEAATAGQTVTSAGKVFNNLIFNGSGGEWTLQDPVAVSVTLSLNNGTLNTNGQTVTAGGFYSGANGPRTLNMGASVFNLTTSGSPWQITPSGFTVNSGTSTINYSGINGFGGGGKSYYDLNFTSTSQFGTQGISGDNTFHNVNFASVGTINGNNTFQNLGFSPGGVITFASGSTQTILGSLSATGGCSGPITMRSSNPGSAASLSAASGSVTVSDITLQDITATGGASFTANNAVDMGGNAGWSINAHAAQNLYWIGNSGNWSDGAHWSTVSGGSASGCSPMSTDNVFFDANSFTTTSPIVTVNVGTAAFRSMDWTGAAYNPGLAGASTNVLKVYGSMTLVSGMTNSFQGLVHFEAQTSGNTIASGGKSFNNAVFFNGSGGAWTLQDALTVAGALHLNAGTLTTNNQALTTTGFNSNVAASRTLNLGSSTFTINNGQWSLSGSGMALNAGTSSILVNGAGSTAFYGAGFTYYDVGFPNTAPASVATLHDDNTFHAVSFASGGSIQGSNGFGNLNLAAGGTYVLSAGKTQTVSGILSAAGNCSGLIAIQSSMAGSPSTLSKASGSVTLSNVSLQGITGAGGASFIANNSIDMGGNTGWTVNPLSSQNLYWIGNSGNWNDPGHWSLTSGGSSSGCTPTAMDNVFFDANSITASTQTITANVPTAAFNDMTWSSMAFTPTFSGSSSNVLKIHGSLTLMSNMNFSFSGQLKFEATSTGKTVNTYGKSIANTVSFNGVGGGWTLQSALITGQNLVLNAGTLTTNNVNLTMNQFQSPGTESRALAMGSSVITLNGFQWSVTGSGMTVAPGTSQINLTSANAKHFYGGGQSYYNVAFQGAGSSNLAIIYDGNTFHDVTFQGAANIIGNNTFENLNLAAKSTVTFTSGTTQTLMGGLTATGDCSGLTNIRSSIPGSPASLAKSTGSIVIDQSTLRDIAASGGATFTANNAVDLGGNSGWTINPLAPQDFYWIGSSGNWSAGSNWSATSGGAPSGCVPTPIDNVSFDANSFSAASQTVTVDIPTAYCKTMSWAGAANSPTFSTSIQSELKIHGSLTLIPGMNFNYSGPIAFEAITSGKTVTTAGKTLNASVSFNGAGGEWILQDALTTSNSLTLSGGTLRTNSLPVTFGNFFSNTAVPRTLDMGSSAFNCNGAFAQWQAGGTGLTVLPGTSSVNFTKYASFAGGGKSYHNLNFQNASVDTISSITGDNVFNNVVFGPSGSISGNNSFQNLTLNAGRTYQFMGGSTQTIAPSGRLFATGTSGSPISIKSLTAGTPASIQKSSGEVCLDYARLTDMSGTGGGTFNAGALSNSQDLGGNSGWVFTGGCSNPSPTDLVWDGGGGDDFWTTATNWAGDTLPAAASHVIFNGASTGDCILNADVAVTSISFQPGFTGAFDFTTHTLTVTGNADFRNLATLTPGTGALVFTGSSGRTLFPKSGQMLPDIMQSGTGLTTVSGAMTAGSLTLTTGSAFNLGATALTHSVTALTGSGSLDFGAANLNVSGDAYLYNMAVVASGNILGFTSSSAQTFTPKTALSTLALAQMGTGATTVAAADFTAPSLAISDGTFNLGSTRSHTIGQFSGTGGTLDFGSSALHFTGAALDFNGLDVIAAGSGSLEFNGSAAHTFTPKAGAAHPAVIQNGSGSTTLATNGLNAGTLTIINGAFNLVSGVHTVTGLGGAAGNGSLDFGSATLRMEGDGSPDFSTIFAIVAGTGTLEFIGSANRSLIAKSGATHPNLKINGTGTTTASGDMTANSLIVAAGTLTINGSLLHLNGALTMTAGELDATLGFLDVDGNVSVAGTSILKFPSAGGGRYFTLGGSISTSMTAGLVPNSGTLVLDGSAAGLTYDVYPALENLTLDNAAGEWTIVNHRMALNGNLIVNAGTLKLGDAFTHSCNGISGTDGTLDFGDSKIQTSGNVDFSDLAGLIPGTGTLEFILSSGTQIFTPLAATEHPAISHAAAGIVRLSLNDLDCASFTQTNGVFDFNGRNISTAVGGDFTVTGGTGTSLANLGGRTLTVRGNASFTGTSAATPINLAPGSPWNLNVTNGLSASLATLANCAATSGTTALCRNCASGVDNTGWKFGLMWDGGGGNQNWSTPANWGLDAVPTSADDVVFDGTATKSMDMDVNGDVASIAVVSGYTGTFNFADRTLTVWTGDADFQSGGPIQAGTGELIFAGSGMQKLIPKSAAAFPKLRRAGAGTLTLFGNPYTGGDLTIASGTVNLGTGLTHTVAAVSGTGTLDFGTGNLNATADVDLSGLTVNATTASTLAFTGGSPQIFIPRTAVTALKLTQMGAGGTTVATADFTTSLLTITQGTFVLGAGRSHIASEFYADGGGLDFGSSQLSLSGASLDFSGLQTLTAATGTLTLPSASDETLIPKSGSALPNLNKPGSGALTLAGDVTAGNLSFAGTLNLGSGFTHSVATCSPTSGNLDFGSSILNITSGAANLGNLSTLTPGTGSLAFTSGSGTQLFTPKAGATHPNLVHSGAGTLQFSGADITCVSFSASAGTLDLNGSDLSTSGGDFTITNGNAASFANLGGRALSVVGDAALMGLVGDHLGLNPDSNWSINVSGALHVIHADVKNSEATGVMAIADSSVDQTGNVNWTFNAIGPPANITDLVATALGESSVALSWTPSISAEADSVAIRYRTGSAYPANSADGTLWRMVPAARTADTLAGLTGNTIYAVALFARNASGSFSVQTASARDTALYQAPVSGSLAIQDAASLTRDPDPALAFGWSGADSLRFALRADTGAAVWVATRAADSLSMASGSDGQRIVMAQFKNNFGTRSKWYADTTVLDRTAPAAYVVMNAAEVYRTWPNGVYGKAIDDLAGTDTVYVLRQRESDLAWYNGTAWTAQADTVRFRTDSGFYAPMPASALATGYYNFSVWSKDRAGNVSAPLETRIRYEDNRPPVVAASTVPDSILQNQTAGWTLDLGELDLGDSVITVTSTLPSWLTSTDQPGAASNGFTAHRVFTFTGIPAQADVGQHTLSVQASDLGGKLILSSRTITVVDVNDAPVFAAGQDSLAVKEDSLFRFKPAYSDADPADAPVLALIRAPAWADLQGSEVVLKPGSRDVGRTILSLTIGDGKALDTLDVIVNVRNVNDAPVAFPSANWKAQAQWREEVADSFTVVVVDMDKSDPVTLTTALPGFLTYRMSSDSLDGYNRYFRFSVSPSQKDTGTLSLKLRFSDAAGAFSELPLSAKISPVNDMPTAVIKGQTASGGAVRLSLDVEDPDGSLASTRFHYRVISTASGDTIRSGISPSGNLDLFPLADGDYRVAVAAEDEGGLKQPSYTLAACKVAGATTLSLDSGRWFMAGFPGRSLSAQALGMGASLTTWDETSENGAPAGRYATGKAADSLINGKGYWIRVAQPVQLAARPGDLVDKPVTLKLTRGKQGWNQIGNPFPYFVDLAATGLTFWEWDAAKRDLVNARGMLKPWGAYWVQVPRDTLLMIRNRPWFPAQDGALAKTVSESAPGMDGTGWSLQLALRAGQYQDMANFMGIRRLGNPKGDEAGDPASGLLPDAPKYGDYIALHFERPGRGGSPADSAASFADDFRQALDPDEEWWDFSVENSASGLDQASLSVPGLDRVLASGLHVFLVKRGSVQALSADAPATLAMDGAVTHYSLVVTPHSDLAARLQGRFSVSQNFPNPVASSTTFRFFLPQTWGADGKREVKAYRLRLNVYDFAGRLAARVVEGNFRPGAHSLIWRPRTLGGNPLAKGAYVYRLEVPGMAKTMKMIVK